MVFTNLISVNRISTVTVDKYYIQIVVFIKLEIYLIYMNYKKYTIEVEYSSKKKLYKNTLLNGEVIGTETNQGIIKGVAKLTEDTKKYEEDIEGLVKIDDEWYPFYQPVTCCVFIKQNPNNSRLWYKFTEKIKLTVEVDEKIDIDSDDLTVIDGIGEARQYYDTIRDILELNYNVGSPIYGSPSHKIPDPVKENIEKRIKLDEAEREVLDREIIKHDVDQL